MKAFGTITACFPYVDEDTKSKLQSTMDEARDYDDFGERLCEQALTRTAPVLFTYFAYFHAYVQGRHDLLNKLVKAKIGSDLTHPFEIALYPHKGNPVEWSYFQKAIASSLKMTDNDWIACHVYMALGEFIEFISSLDPNTDYEPLDILQSKIKNDEEFGFFLSSLHRIKAKQFQVEGNIEEARIWYDHAIAVAVKYDDLGKLANLLQEKANLIKNVNIGEAMSILKIQKALCDRLGYIDGCGLHAHCLGHIAMARGEYDVAIDHQNEFLALRESIGQPVGFIKLVIALLYNLKGDGKTALRLIDDGKKDMASSATNFARIQESLALLNLDRVDDATRVLDEAKESSLKSGKEVLLGYIHLVEGLIEKRYHEYSSALLSLSEALDIFERLKAFAFANITLVSITDAEIEAYPYGKKAAQTEFSGPWMQRLKKQVEDRELPGIAAQSMLLKAKFQFKQGRFAEANKLLKKVLKASETSGMKYLREMAGSLIPDLVTSLEPKS